MDKLQRGIEKLFSLPDWPVDEKRKRIFLSLCIIISMPATTIYGLIDLFQGRWMEGTLVVGNSFVMIGVLFLLRHLREMNFVYRFCGFLGFSLLLYEMAVGGGEGYAILWFYFYPITIFFLLGRKEGLLWTLTMPTNVA